MFRETRNLRCKLGGSRSKITNRSINESETQGASAVPVEEDAECLRIGNPAGFPRGLQIRCGFFNEFVQIVKPAGIQQPQASKMAGNTELFGRRRQEQQSRCSAAQSFDKTVLGAWIARGPGQVMGLIDDHHVPTGFECLCRPIFVLSKPLQAAKNELPVQKWIHTRVSRLDIFASLLIENVKPEIETPEEFNEPLMHQRFRNKNKSALHTAG